MEILGDEDGGRREAAADLARQRMLELLRKAGVMGMTRAAIVAKLEAERVTRASYGRWKAAV